jgi:hypothetical protein
MNTPAASSGVSNRISIYSPQGAENITLWIPDSSAPRASLPGSIPLTLQTSLRLFSASVIDLNSCNPAYRRMCFPA